MLQSAQAAEYTNSSSAKGYDSLNEYRVYDVKQFDGEAQIMMELWGIWSTSSLTSLSGPLWME